MPKSTLSGLSNLTKTLESLGDDLRDRDMAYATKKSADLIRDRAKVLAPVDSGKLRRNIVSRKDKDTLHDSEYLVGVRSVGKSGNPNNAFYGYFVEYGHDARPPMTRKSLRKHRAGQSHHEIPPQPFLEQAWEQQRQVALNEFRDRISRRVASRDKQIAKGRIKTR